MIQEFEKYKSTWKFHDSKYFDNSVLENRCKKKIEGNFYFQTKGGDWYEANATNLKDTNFILESEADLVYNEGQLKILVLKVLIKNNSSDYKRFEVVDYEILLQVGDKNNIIESFAKLGYNQEYAEREMRRAEMFINIS